MFENLSTIVAQGYRSVNAWVLAPRRHIRHDLRQRLQFVQVFAYGRPMAHQERRHHWWNGETGQLARHDINIYEADRPWTVEAREGGSDGTSRLR
jgi:hypothetical protein